MADDGEILHLGAYTERQWNQNRVMPCLCGFIVMYDSDDQHNAFFKDYWQDPKHNCIEEANCDGCILMRLASEE